MVNNENVLTRRREILLLGSVRESIMTSSKTSSEKNRVINVLCKKLTEKKFQRSPAENDADLSSCSCRSVVQADIDVLVF
jgi:hypothetical protein